MANYIYKGINDPLAADESTANGISDAGEIVGSYLSGGVVPGFYYSAGTFTTIKDPSATSITEPYALNYKEQIVGDYYDGKYHGFTYSGGVYTTLDDPLATSGSTSARGINSNGQIVGYYEQGGNTNGFLYSGGKYYNISDPLAFGDTEPTGINDEGTIVGTYRDNNGVPHGFVYSNNKYVTIDDPLATIGTLPTGINNLGQIVGTYGDDVGIHGFVYNAGVYTTLDDPSASMGTHAFGINNLGQVVGVYYDDFGTHGFTATTTPRPPLDIAPSAQSEVAYLSGVNSDGTLAHHSYWPFKGTTAHKWIAGGSGTSGPAGVGGGTITYSFAPSNRWTPAEEESFTNGLKLWSAVANIQFQVATGSAADIIFFPGRSDFPGAQTKSFYSSNNGNQLSGINPQFGQTFTTIDTTEQGYQNIDSFTKDSGLGLDTVLHEEGHLLGLGHGGPYPNNDSPLSGSDQNSPYDTMQWTLMSYFQPDDKTAYYYSTYPGAANGTHWNFGLVKGRDNPRTPYTWMPLDILAAQRLYGVATQTPLSGGQVFGYNCNIDASTGIRSFFDFTVDTMPVVTLYDTGIGNKLDLSGCTSLCTVNLNPGTFSSFDGMINNLAIAYGTEIDSYAGGTGRDVVKASAVANPIDGGGGDNTVDYSLSTAGVAVNLANGAASGGFAQGDSLLHIQNLVGSAFADTLTGDGNANTLDGGAGADVLNGGGGNDVYHVDNAGDTVFEAPGGGRDTVLASVSYALTQGTTSEVEVLEAAGGTSGTTAINLSGNDFGNTIVGNAAANVLNGEGGADKMYGEAGNDTYYVDNAGDQVIEAANGGTDTVFTSVNYALQSDSSVETLRTTDKSGASSINLTGNNLAQTIYGNAGNNVINGGGGDDTLLGFGGHDIFLFNTAPNTSTNDVTIGGFSVPNDMIELHHALFSALSPGALPSTAFYAGMAAHSSSDRIIYNPGTGALSYDADGNGAGAAVQFAKLSAGLTTLSASNFKVV